MGEAPRKPRPPYELWVLLAELTGLSLLRLPSELGFNAFGFADIGGNLTANYLIGQGLKPAVDFGYPYGLLGLFTGRVWFAVWGQSPLSCEGAMWLCEALIVFAIVRWLKAVGGGNAALLACVLMLPMALFGFETFSHALEALFIFNAMASQAAGHKPRALACCVAAVFSKPAMGYFFGLVLTGLILFEFRRERRTGASSLLLQFAPAAGVAAIMAVILGLYFGARSLASTILPFKGAQGYAASNLGFFRNGSYFWKPLHPTVAYYLESPAGFWLAATMLLIAACGYSLARHATSAMSSPSARRTRELLLSCAWMQIIAVAVLWGNEFSYQYYCFVLVLGLLAAMTIGPRWRAAVLAVALLVPLGKVGVRSLNRIGSMVARYQAGAVASANRTAAAPRASVPKSHTYAWWLTRSRTAITAGLWASAGEREEWGKVLDLIRGHPAALLKTNGCAELLFPEFSKPVGLYLDKGLPLPRELAARSAQIANSAMMVVPTDETALLEIWPALGRVVSARFKVVFRGDLFTVFEKVR
jgi:hypothetical protein